MLVDEYGRDINANTQDSKRAIFDKSKKVD
jgi:hypothetical protein